MNRTVFLILLILSPCIRGTTSGWLPESLVGLEYPQSALLKGQQGVVRVDCYLLDDGTVSRAEPISEGKDPIPDLEAAAARNAMKWKFKRDPAGLSRYAIFYDFKIVSGATSSEWIGFRYVGPNRITVSARSQSER